MRSSVGWKRTRAASPRPALAVLPFETLGGSGDSALGEGLHSGILTRLSQLESLAVIARRSVHRFRGSAAPASVIGAELGVQWILEGDVQIGGETFQVNVRLVEAGRDRQVWGRKWGGELSSENFFQVQAEIAGEIVETLPIARSPGERLLVAQRPTESLEAYRLCAQGRMHLRHRTEESMEQALASFDEALALDPDYAPAHVGLADALGLLHAYGHRDASVLDRAEQAIRTALEREPSSAEAHAAWGRLLGQRRREREAAREMRRAVELRPGYAEAHSWAAVGHTVGGRPGEALRSAHRAVVLNPLSPKAIYNLGVALLINGKPDDALREARRVRELEPDYAGASLLEGMILYETRRFPQAVECLEGLVVPWAGSAADTLLALCRAAVGDADEAWGLLQGVREAGHPFDEGVILAALDQPDRALEALDRARFDGVDFDITYWPTVAVRYLFSDLWDAVRPDPRYQRLVQRIDRSWGL